MRCHICDKTLTEKEVSWNNDCDEFEPCGVCLIAISEIFHEAPDEQEVTEGLIEEFGYGYVVRDETETAE